MENLKSFESLVRERFAESKTLWHQEVGFGVSSEGGLEVTRQGASRAPIGFRMEDKERVLIFRTNGFTYSKLAPYKKWNDLREAAKALWAEFVQVVKPEVVTRIAVRYVNVLPLPVDLDDFSSFLEAAPSVPKALPQGLASFLQRVVMVDPQQGRQAIVTQALENSQQAGNTVDVILDIDAFRQIRAASSADEVWSGLDNLRDFKNDIFFEHITERTASIFE